ncbi:transposase [Ruegeria profundi]|uniref:transposase n=1 Tax=Ruegeria profundi TaxID=1685378 RepID=UPI003C7D7A0F
MWDLHVGAVLVGDYQLDFDNRVCLEFHGSRISSDGGLFLFLELDKTLGLHDLAGQMLRDTRTDKKGFHVFVALFCQSTFGRLAGNPDVDDANLPARDPVKR